MNAPVTQIEFEPKTRPAPTFSLVPQNLTEAMQLSKLIAESDLAPKDYKGKPGNVLIAVQMGLEMGLSPMSAIQNVAVINGKPSIYGDAGKALLQANGFTIEEDDIAIIKKTGMGRCKITRPGKPPVERTFSIENAKIAGLWNKAGPWTQYPERQLAWRAFWFAARDAAADVLKGITGAEEIRDVTERDVTPTSTTDAAPSQPASLPPMPEEKFNENLPTYLALIESGKKSADDILAFISTKYTLTEAQRAKIAPPVSETVDGNS